MGTCPSDRPPVDAGIEGSVVREGGPLPEGQVIMPWDADPIHEATTCDVTGSPSTTPCLVTEGFGLFVSPSKGVSVNPGTRTAPLNSIGNALAAARETHKNIYVCNGASPITASVVIDASLGGIKLYGGFDCDSWRYTGEATIVKSLDIPLVIKDVSTSVTIEDFAFKAADATEPGKSSIAAFVSSSANVRLTRVRLEAGAGKDGADGESRSNYLLRVNPALDSVDSPTGPRLCAEYCLDKADHTGGRGGKARDDATLGESGGPGTPMFLVSIPPSHNGAGGLNTKSCINGGAGNSGSNAPNASGGKGAVAHGQLAPGGWSPMRGDDGTTGMPGQGGGGGAGQVVAGGSGACGGCGGAGGQGGQGGGSSVALFSYMSTVRLESCALLAGSAGHGGRGANGQAGQSGGGYALSPSSCSGGAGGLGGSGGGGGGGAGGISAGIGFVGTEPERIATDNVVVGRPGRGGDPGVNGTSESQGDAGLDAGSDAPLIEDASTEDVELLDGWDDEASVETEAGAGFAPPAYPASSGKDGVAEPVVRVLGS